MVPTAVAWEATVHSINELMVSVQKLAGSDESKTSKPPSDPEESASVEDYVSMAADIREAATQLNSVVERLESDKLSNVVTNLESLSESTLADASAQVASLVNLITIRAALLIGALVVALLIYRVTVSRLVKTK